MLSQYKVILWDFDGVIMDSMPIRDKGFEEVLKHYPQRQVEELLNFHRQNGGLSRYVKFRYFFEKIRNEAITDEQVNELAKHFSDIMLSLLKDEKLLIRDSVLFIKSVKPDIDMHIVSGSDGNELKQICASLGLNNYFKSIHGSPTPKKKLVKDILAENNYDKASVVLIGDSINDLDACNNNGIDFFGYNNENLKLLSDNYITAFGNISR